MVEEDFESRVRSCVSNFVDDPSDQLIFTCVNYVEKGYGESRLKSKLSEVLEGIDVSGLVEKLLLFQDASQGRKRKFLDKENGDDKSRKKVKKFTEALPDPTIDMSAAHVEATVPEPTAPVSIPERTEAINPIGAIPVQRPVNSVTVEAPRLTADKIKEMMANARQMIAARKAELNIPDAMATAKQLSSVQSKANEVMLLNDAREKVKRAQELQAQIQSRLQNTNVSNILAASAAKITSVDREPRSEGVPSRPSALILGQEGLINKSTGESVNIQTYVPTLKANIRAKKREQFRQKLYERPSEEMAEANFFDHRVKAKAPTRIKRNFKFFESGKFEKIANQMRTKAQLERLQGEIAQIAKKTGLTTSVSKLHKATPKAAEESYIPNVEWWDTVLFEGTSYDPVSEGVDANEITGITDLVEHPIQMKPPVETKAGPVKVYLTKKERRKLRRQTRKENLFETQEKVRLGLIPPMEPKVRLANLMRVLGNDAIQNPSKVEAHVRAQMQKRQKAHEEANLARKLSKEQRQEKKNKKLADDTAAFGIHISVYRVENLSDPSRKFKVEMNAKQLLMTGFVALYKDCNVIVVEGGPKQQKKFRQLMLNRIKWEENKGNKSATGSVSADMSGPGGTGGTSGAGSAGDTEEEDETPRPRSSYCKLIWQGSSKERAFSDMMFKTCPTETFAREQFRRHGVESYWDHAYTSLLDEKRTDVDT